MLYISYSLPVSHGKKRERERELDDANYYYHLITPANLGAAGRSLQILDTYKIFSQFLGKENKNFFFDAVDTFRNEIYKIKIENPVIRTPQSIKKNHIRKPYFNFCLFIPEVNLSNLNNFFIFIIATYCNVFVLAFF